MRLPLLLVALMSYSGLLSQTTAGMSEPERQIRNHRTASNQAIAAHDTAALATYWTNDVLVLTSRNAENSGKRKNQAAFQGEFTTKEDVLYVRSTDHVDVFAAAGMASESGRWVGSWKNGNEEIEVTGTYYAKWVNVNEQWLIRAEVYTPLTCKGKSYCNTFVK